MAHAQRRSREPRLQPDSSLMRPPLEAGDSGASAASAASAAASDADASEVSIYGKKPLPPTTSLGVADDEYHMAHRYRGKAIVFNHERFADNLPDMTAREGTKADCERLKESLKKLGFVVKVLNDQKRKDIIDKVTKEKGNHYHYSSDCLVIVVLTHGDKDGLLYAHDSVYSVNELIAPFMAENCPALATKPKIFIIQACRGDVASRAVGVNMARLTTDSTRTSPDDEPRPFSIPSEADVLVAYSTYEGRFAYRDTEDGTWYISELCDELGKNAKTDDLLSMLTRVNRQVALTKEAGESKQMPMIQSTLTRKIFFSKDRDKQNVPISSLQEIGDKLDRLLALQESCRATPTPSAATDCGSPVFLRRLQTFSAWDELRAGALAGALAGAGPPPPAGTLPAEDAALRHARALKMFLEDERGRRLEDAVQESGRTLLLLLSLWDALDAEARAHAHRKAQAFLRAHAKEWPVLQVVDIPEAGLEPPSPREPRARKSSRSSTQSVSSVGQAPKRPPFKM